MKKTNLVFSIAAFVFMIGSLSANCLPDFCTNISSFCTNVSVVGRVAYFYPVSKKVRDIYDNGWADYQVEISKEFYPCIQGWIGVSGFSKQGHSIGFGNRTRLQLIPLSFGLKYVYPLMCNLEGYAGLGACYSFLKIRDHSNYVIQHISKNDWGGIAQLGVNYYVYNCFFVNVFVDYYFQKFNFHHVDYSYYTERHNLNISAWKFGGGVGYRF